MTEENFAWFAGIDWGSERHQACLVDAQGRIVGEREFPHGGKGLADLCDWLLSMCGAADTVAVGIEVPHGPEDLLCTRSIRSSSTACATGTAWPVRRMTVATPTWWAMACAPTGACSAACMSPTRGWSSCGRGRALPRN